MPISPKAYDPVAERAKRLRLLSVYRSWGENMSATTANYITLCGALVSTIMLAFDKIFVKESTPYLAHRISFLIFAAANLYLISLIGRVENKTIRNYLSSWFLCSPVLLFWATYLDIVFYMPAYNDFVYYMGAILVGIFGTFMLHRFWREQYLFNVLGIFSLMGVLATGSLKRDQAFILIIVHITSAWIAIYQRRQFVAGLYERYNLLQAMLPQQLAHFLVTSDGATKRAEFFPPKNRFAACLSADWRSFQRMCAERTSSEISKLLETFYDIVNEDLVSACPSGDYFVTWTADELFITFYHPEDDRRAVIDNTLRFAHILATSTFHKIQSTLGKQHPIRYDIGVSSGLGLLGMLGPKLMKKTTIIGEFAGIARRLEQEAAKQRKILNVTAPILMIDDVTLYMAQDLGLSFVSEFQKVETSTKDIQQLAAFLWCEDRVSIQDNSEKSKGVKASA